MEEKLYTLDHKVYNNYNDAIAFCVAMIYFMCYCSLGPTDNSIEDFWRMIWEGNIPTIVMLTRIFEGRVRLLAK